MDYFQKVDSTKSSLNFDATLWIMPWPRHNLRLDGRRIRETRKERIPPAITMREPQIRPSDPTTDVLAMNWSDDIPYANTQMKTWHGHPSRHYQMEEA